MKKIFIVVALALIFRFWHLAEFAKFSYDEARDAIAQTKILSGDFTLLGPESLIGDKTIYFGPLHYYLMAPSLKFSNFDPLGPYFFTAAIGAVTAGILVWQFGWMAGLLYAVFPIAVIYNRWAWNPNTIPFFITLALVAFKKRKFFLTGLFWGLAVQLHWMVLPFGFFILLHRNLKKVILGFIVGVLPILIFDLRHNFLYIKSLLSLFNGISDRTFTWHYFLWMIPLVCIYLPNKIKLLSIAISFSLSVYWLSGLKSDLPLNPLFEKQIVGIIATDQKLKPNLNFNVISFYGGDYRATNLRYFLLFENITPLGKAEYDVADHLYVVSSETKEKVLYNGLYEISSFKPIFVSKSWQVAGTNLYRLEKK